VAEWALSSLLVGDNSDCNHLERLEGEWNSVTFDWEVLEIVLDSGTKPG